MHPCGPASLSFRNNRSHFNQARSKHTCPLCSQPLSVEHVLLACPAPAVVRTRLTLLSSISPLMGKLARYCLFAQAVHEFGRDEAMTMDFNKAEREVAAMLTPSVLSSPEGCFILLRVLLLTPWSAHSLQQPSIGANGQLVEPPAAATVLGGLFDATAVPNHLLRTIANKWARYSATHTLRIMHSWSAAIDDLPSSALAAWLA